jgi:glycosyltransferase involved in cell wall biosynthesis
VEEALMAKILALTSRLPYPPREGHQLRSWHLLSAIARKHDVTLLSFVRDDDVLDDCAVLRETMSRLETFPIDAEHSRLALGRALTRGLLGRFPFVAEKYFSAELTERVTTLARDVDLVHVDMLPLMINLRDVRVPIVLNAHNVEHVLIERRVEIETRPLHRAFLRRQKTRLKNFEADACRRSAQILACSDNDAEQLSQLAPSTPIAVVPNGVDTGAIESAPASTKNPPQLIFVGQMGWFPNRHGVEWFFADVLPRIVQVRPDVQFVLVGKNDGLRPPPSLSANVRLLGFVDDLKSVMAEAAVYAVPLRAGSGTRLKVLEAMAFGKAIVTTHIGSEGIALREGENALFADTAEEFAAAVLRLL